MLLEQIKAEIDQLISNGQHKELHSRALRNKGLIEIRGKKLIDFTNWDLLGINENPKFKREVQKIIDESGLGSTSSRLSSGTTINHISCEKRLASFLGQQSALLFSSKNQALFTLLTALSNESDHIFYDEQLQSPAADLAYLVSAQSTAFNSSNLTALNNELSLSKTSRRKFIVLETISPITGRKIDLEQLFQITLKHQAYPILDESFALGNFGLRGAGLMENFKAPAGDFCVFGSLGNTLPCYGGFVAGSGLVTNYLIQRSKTLAHEPSVPSALATGIEEAVNIAELSQQDRVSLVNNISILRSSLAKQGFLDANQSDSAVVSIMIGSTKKASQVANLLISKGFFVDVISLSTSLTDIGLIRLIVTTMHQPQQLETVSIAISEAVAKLLED